MIKRLGHICLGVSSLPDMINFYEKYCDCKIVHEFINPQNERYGVMLRVANSATFIELFQDNNINKSNNHSFRHLSFQVDDINIIKTMLENIGDDITVYRGKTDKILQCWCNDPDGNKVEFTQFDELSVYSGVI